MIGLSTYAFLWRSSDRAPEALDLFTMLEETRRYGVDLFQICDFPGLLNLTDSQLRELRGRAEDLGIALELGTRGVGVDHLHTFLGLADILGVCLVRSMIYAPDHRPTLSEAAAMLDEVAPAFEGEGVRLALETYEQVRTKDLVSIIEDVASPNVGICLDPPNSVAALEHPNAVIDRCAPYVLNVHVKDFKFSRRGGWVGFTLEGAPMGTGLLDYQHLVTTVDPESRGINRVVEHWLPWHETYEETAQLEDEWTVQAIEYLRENA